MATKNKKATITRKAVTRYITTDIKTSTLARDIVAELGFIGLCKTPKAARKDYKEAGWGEVFPGRKERTYRVILDVELVDG